MDSNLKRTIILEHYQNPKNKGLINDDSYTHINMNNESCIDEINLMVSATSVMISTLIGKSVSDAKEILRNYEYMIDEKEYNEEILEEASIYSDIAKQPNRKKCALLAWWGIKKVIGDDNEKI